MNDRYSYHLPKEKEYGNGFTDATNQHPIDLLVGMDTDTANYNDVYYYYRGCLPPGDYADYYHAFFPHDLRWNINKARIWIYATDTLDVYITYRHGTNGNDVDYVHYHLFGGQWLLFEKALDSYQGIDASIVIESDGNHAPAYLITAYVIYDDYIGEGDGDNGGGSGVSPGIPNPPPTPLWVGGFATAPQILLK